MDALCTIVAKNYIAYARTLVRSFLQHHPTGRAYVLLADEPEGELERNAEPFEWVRLHEIGVPDLRALEFKYDVTELSTAVKPFFMEHLLRTRGVTELIYLDPDILVTHRLDALYRRLQHANALLTPHLLTPLPDDKLRPEEIDILQAGVYNLGFLGLSRSEETFRLLAWWKERLTHYCLMEPAKGYHVDQGWMDLAPALFDGIQLVREPTYNAAYWNLHERKITYRDGLFEANGKPLAFYHFSGFVPDLSRISRHLTRYDWSHHPELATLYRQYASKLAANGHANVSHLRYAFNHFDNNVRIPPLVRAVYRRLGASASRFGNPFETLNPNGFYQWLFFPQHSPTGLPRLLQEIYDTRVDLQRAFTDPYGSQRLPFLKWAKPFVPLEYGVDPLVWHPVMDAAGYR